MATPKPRLEWAFFDGQVLDDGAWSQLTTAGGESPAADNRDPPWKRRRVLIPLLFFVLLVGAPAQPPVEARVNAVLPVVDAPHIPCTANDFAAAATRQNCHLSAPPRPPQPPRCRSEMDPIEQHQSQRPPTYPLSACTNP